MANPLQTLAIVTTPPNDNVPQWNLETITVQPFAENELLIEVIATGVCHTDITASLFPIGQGGIYPKVMGHEGAGYVKEVGSAVNIAKPGDAVVLSFASCTSCTLCKTGHPAYCERFFLENFMGRMDLYRSSSGAKIAGGFFGQSSFSKFAIASESSVVNVEGLVKSKEELKLFAPFGCGLQTGAASVLNRAQAKKGDSVAVIGLGGVGMAAIMTSKLTGCYPIIAIDIVDSKLQLAKELGATILINSSDRNLDLAAEVKRLTGEIGPSVTIDATGLASIAEKALELTATLGRLVVVGVSSRTAELNLNLSQLMSSGKIVMSSVEGDASSSEFVPRMIQWYREGKFPVEKIINYFEASDFQSALAGMKDGSVIKPVLVW